MLLQTLWELIGALPVPRQIVSGLGPAAETGLLLLHVAAFYACLLAAAWQAVKWSLGGGLARDIFGFSVFGLTAGAAGLLIGSGISAGVLAPAWEGIWHAAVALPWVLWITLRLDRRSRPEDAQAAEVQLQASAPVTDRDKLLSMISQTSDGILMVNRQGRLDMMNAAAERLLDVKSREVAGQPISLLAGRVQFYTEDQRLLPLEEWALSRALREGTIANEQSVQLFPFKSRGVFLRVTASPLRDSQGRVDTVVCVLKDLTAHRQLDILKEELFSKPVPIQELPSRPAAAPEPEAPAKSPSPGAGAVATSSFLKSFLWEQAGEATKMGASFLDQIPSVLPDICVPAAPLRSALGYIVRYALQATAAGGMVRVWASAKDQHVFIGVRDGGLGMVPDEVTRFSDQLDSLSTAKGDQTRNPLYPLILAKEELASLGIVLNVRSEGLKKGTEYYFLVPAGNPAPGRREAMR